MERKFLISVCDIDKRRFGNDFITMYLDHGASVRGKLVKIGDMDGFSAKISVKIDGLPPFLVSPGLVVEIEEAERPGDSKENPIILNHDNFKEEYIGKWCRWDDRPRYSIAKLRSRSVIVETWTEGLLKETTTYSFVGADADPRSFIRSLKAT